MALSLSLAACRDSVSPVPPSATIQRVVVDTTDAGKILLSVVLSQPATVDVEYWDDPTHKLGVQVAEPTTEGSLVLQQLRAGRRYHYEASALNAAGGRGAVASGDFSVPSLPDDLAQVAFDASGTPSNPLTMLEVNGFRYSWHGYSDDERRFGGSALMRIAPFLGPVLIIEVHKVASAPRHLT